MEGWRNLNALEQARHVEDALRLRLRQRRREIRTITNPFLDMTTSDFVKLYRLPQRMVLRLIDEIRPEMQLTEHGSSIPVELKVLAALSFFASGSYQRVVGQDFCHTMSQSMVSRSIHEVIAAVNVRLVQQWIKFPMIQAERNIIKERFFAATGISGTIGAVDCSHIAIVRPAVHEEHFLNRKSYHSLNVQVENATLLVALIKEQAEKIWSHYSKMTGQKFVCDYDMRILSLNARYAGATADAFIWRNSSVKQVLARRYAALERGEWIIGDSGYASEPWLLTPILHAEPGSPEEHYTAIHCRSRCCVERCFGVLKARWRCLLRHRCLHYDPHTARQIVNTCAVLHNMAIDARLPDPEPLTEEEAAQELALDAGDIVPAEIDIDQDFLGCAREVRARLVALQWRRR